MLDGEVVVLLWIEGDQASGMQWWWWEGLKVLGKCDGFVKGMLLVDWNEDFAKKASNSQ